VQIEEVDESQLGDSMIAPLQSEENKEQMNSDP
jgi:hypothetical protein